MHAVAPSNNKKLFEFLGASRLPDRESDEFCDTSDLIFNSVLNNITEYIYYDEPKLELPGRKLQTYNQVTLTLLHINLQSLNNFANLDALDEFLSSLLNTPDIVCISETRLKGEPLINISIRTIILFMPIGAIYRHPNSSKNNIENFAESLCNSINKITNRKGIIFIIRNRNIDISINKRTPNAASYIDHLISCGSIPIITIPSRVTEVSSTIIDHIITNDTSHAIKPGVIR